MSFVPIKQITMTAYNGSTISGTLLFTDGTERFFQGYTEQDIIFFRDRDNAIVIDQTGQLGHLATAPPSNDPIRIVIHEVLANGNLRVTIFYQNGTSADSIITPQFLQELKNFYPNLVVVDETGTTPPPPIPVGCVVFTATADNGISRFFQTTEQDYLNLLLQFPNNIGISEPTPDCDARQDPIVVIDFLQTAVPPPSPPPSTNNLVIVQTACGNQRVVMTDPELQSFQMGNFLPAPAPSTLTYQISGKVSEESNYDQFLGFAARCYNVTVPIPPRGAFGGGSLSGIVMFLMALGTLLSGKFGK